MPPHARKAAAPKTEKEPEKKGIEDTVQNFPPLSNGVARATAWGNPVKSYAQLANEWKTHEEKELEQKAIDKQRTEDMNAERHRSIHPLPHFHNIGRHVEPDDEEYNEEEPVQKPTPLNDDAGWQVVDHRKYRREKTLEEKYDRPPTPEEDTVWNEDQQEEYETCWDDKRY